MGERIAVVGSDHVGTVVAACLAHIGHDVVGVEPDPARLATLRAASAPFHEPGLNDLITCGLLDGHLRFTDDMREAMDASDVVFVCVGTPLGTNGEPDMTTMTAVTEVIAENLRHYHVLVTKCTSPVGTGYWMRSRLEDLAGREGRDRFSIVCNPEVLRQGSAVEDFLHPDRVVLGSDDPKARQIAMQVLRPILDQQIPGYFGKKEDVPLLHATLTAAEMIGYASAAFWATKVGFVNELANLCDAIGADVAEVRAGMDLDRRVGWRFPGADLGWGDSGFGSPLPPLTDAAHAQPQTASGAVALNEPQRRFVVDQLLGHLGTLHDAKVCILGLSFTPPTVEPREAPQPVGVPGLNGVRPGDSGDPLVTAVPDVSDIRLMPGAIRAATGADAIVLATEWPQFLSLRLSELRRAMRGDLFFDSRNNFDPALVEQAGFRYVGDDRTCGALRPRTPCPQGKARSAPAEVGAR